MKLKYQTVIDNLKLPFSCPFDMDESVTEVYAYRFSFIPIEHELNFLPNVEFDRLRKIPINYGSFSDDRKCKRCGASFYLSDKAARSQWNSLSNKIRTNLGYTHLAYGKLTSNDGKIGKAINDHFGFYEADNVDLKINFEIAKELS